MAAPKAKFMMLGKSKFVHVVRTKVWDLKHSECQQVRKFQVAGNVPKGKGLSPEATMALEPCPHCEPVAVVREMIGDSAAKKAAKQRTQDTLDKMRDARKAAEPKSKRKSKPAIKVNPPNRKEAAKARKSGTGDKAPKSRKPQMTTTGPKSLGGDEEKANILKEFAEEHGWKVKVSEDKPGYKLVATRGDETITCWFDGGKYDIGRMGYVTVKGSDWQGKLRAAHACRRQMSAEGRDRPHPNPGAGRSAPRSRKEEPTPETEESPEDAFKRVPFLVDDDELTIIDAVKGRVIRWRNGISGEVEEAQLPAEANGKKRPKIVITTHPTKNRRILHFFAVAGLDGRGREVYGSERSVAIDKIIRVL